MTHGDFDCRPPAGILSEGLQLEKRARALAPAGQGGILQSATVLLLGMINQVKSCDYYVD